MDLKSQKIAADKKSEELKKEMALCEQVIGPEMGESEIGILPSSFNDYVFEVKYAHRSKDKLDTEKLKTFYPEVYEACQLPPSQWRQLSITEVLNEEREKKKLKKKKSKKK